MTSTSITPTATRGARMTAGLTLAAGALFVVVPLLEGFVSDDAFALMGLAGLLVLLALPGLRRIQEGADGRAGSVGLRLMLGGLVLVVALVLSGDLLDAALSGTAQAWAEGAFAVLGVASVLALFAGVLSFSVGMTRARVFPRPAIWVFLGGMALALVAEAFEQSLSGAVPGLADLLPVVGVVVAGCGLLMLGSATLRLAGRAPSLD
jgi:hypothetical protein